MALNFLPTMLTNAHLADVRAHLVPVLSPRSSPILTTLPFLRGFLWLGALVSEATLPRGRGTEDKDG